MRTVNDGHTDEIYWSIRLDESEPRFDSSLLPSFSFSQLGIIFHRILKLPMYLQEIISKIT